MAAALLLAIAPQVTAVEIARVTGFGPASRAFAGGGIAQPVGAGAMLSNPAELLSLAAPHEFMSQLTYLSPTVDIINDDTGEKARTQSFGNNRGPYYLPEIAFAWLSGDWAFGFGAFTSGGLGLEFGSDTFLSTTTTNHVQTGLPISARLTVGRIPFAVAWSPHPRLRLGASLEAVNITLNMATLLDAAQVDQLNEQGRLGGSLAPIILLLPGLSGAHLNFVRDHPLAGEFSSWGIGGRLGATLVLGDRARIAATYEFESAVSDPAGEGRITAIDGLNNQYSIGGSGRLPGLQTPQAWVVGMAYDIRPQLTVVADVRRTYWNETLGDTPLDFVAQENLRLQNGAGGPAIPLPIGNNGTLSVTFPTGFNNLTTLSLGLEWSANPVWTLRAGYAKSLQETVDGPDLFATFPSISNETAAIGMSHRSTTGHEFAFTLTYARGEVRNPGNTPNSVPPITGQNEQLNPTLSYSYRF